MRSHAARSLFRRWCLLWGTLYLSPFLSTGFALSIYQMLCFRLLFFPSTTWTIPSKFVIKFLAHAKPETCVDFLLRQNLTLPIVIISPFEFFFLVRNGFFWHCCEVWEGAEVFDFVSKHPPCGICPLHLLEWGDLPFEGHLFLCIILLWCALSCLSSSSLRAREKEEEGGVGGWN